MVLHESVHIMTFHSPVKDTIKAYLSYPPGWKHISYHVMLGTSYHTWANDNRRQWITGLPLQVADSLGGEICDLVTDHKITQTVAAVLYCVDKVLQNRQRTKQWKLIQEMICLVWI